MYVFSTITILLILLQSGSIIQANTEQASSEILIEPSKVEIPQPFVDSIRKYLIHFSNPEALENFVSQHDVKRVYPHLKMVIVEDMLSERDNLNSIDGVMNVFDLTNTKYTQIKQPEDPVYLVSNAEKIKLTKQTADILNVSFLWDLGYKGSSIIAYDIDSGINTQHVDFQGRIMEESKSFITKGNGYKINDPSIEDEDGHGTHTAGIMAGAGIGNDEYIGMAPEAQILVGRLGSPAPPEAFIAAFEYALELKEAGTVVDVINLSWGGTDTEGQDAEEAMIRELYLNNILVAVAAGNSGTSYYTAESPGAEAQSISVAATKQTGQGQAYFSSVGPTADGYVKPDLAAPGMGIMSCGIESSEDYVSMQGTSMATPAITGAAAVLINALKGESIPYDAGMIKTAMMLAGDGQGSDYLQLGAGVPDLGKALDLIEDAPRNASGFPVLLWAIPELNVPFYQQMNQGFYGSIYVKSVSSTPWEDKEPVLSGTITQIASLNTTPATDPWDKNYELIFDVPQDIALGDYEGKITFETSQGVTAETIIKVKVVAGEKRILLAKMNTNWGADHLLGQYVYFVEDLNSKGIAVNEISKGEITSELLADYDALWFADPFNIMYPNFPSTKAETYGELTDDEIAAIQDYVENGGSLFIDLLGKTKDPDYGLTIGNNITVVNKLIEPFDIQVDTGYYTFEEPLVARVKNTHRITENVTKVDHYGTYLTTTGTAVELLQFEGDATAAAFENENGGRVVVCTTNFFIDTEGFVENYNDGTTNAVFADNIIKWLLADNKVVVHATRSDNTVNFDITAVPSSTSLSASLTYVDAEGTETVTDITLTNTGTGTYTYSLTMEQDGKYTLEILTPDDKYLGQFILDNSPPIFMGSDGWVNGSAMTGSYIDFIVKDELSSINNVSVTLNGEEITITVGVSSATFRIYLYHLSQQENIIHVYAEDDFGNILDANYVLCKTTPTEPTEPTDTETPTKTPYPSIFVGLLSLISLIYILRRKQF